jgi:hypothetical protein
MGALPAPAAPAPAPAPAPPPPPPPTPSTSFASPMLSITKEEISSGGEHFLGPPDYKIRDNFSCRYCGQARAKIETSNTGIVNFNYTSMLVLEFGNSYGNIMSIDTMLLSWQW